MRPAHIYQIYYDEATRDKVMPGFIPLDNLANERPDWFEFWVILNYLRTHTLDENALYGFISPKFMEKTGISSISVLETIRQAPPEYEVFLFSAGWDQICYFLNPWEQAEVWHPGLTDLTQQLLQQCSIDVDLTSMVADSTCSVLSNYMVGTPRFWRTWQWFAEKIFHYLENGGPGSEALLGDTSYGLAINRYPMKTFIQERLATLVLATCDFKVYAADRSTSGQIFTRLFTDDLRTRRLLQSCDLMKLRYRETGEQSYLDMYRKLKKEIVYTPPVM